MELNAQDVSQIPQLYIHEIEGNELSPNISLEQRLCGLKKVQLIIPDEYLEIDDYIFGNFKTYLSQLGLDVTVTFSKAIKHKIIQNTYGNNDIIKLDYSDGATETAYLAHEDSDRSFNLFSITLCYVKFGNKITLGFQGLDLNNILHPYNRRFEVPANNSKKFISECRKHICFNRNFNSRYEYRPSFYKSNYNRQDISTYFENAKEFSPFEGIYVGDDNAAKLAIIKDMSGVHYVLFYDDDTPLWAVGDIIAILRPTSNLNLFLADWYGNYKKTDHVKVDFNDMGFSIIEPNSSTQFYKTYPTAINNNASKYWTGTGFAIGGRFIVTNNHVIDEAKNINVIGIDGDFNYEYHANVIAVDKSNDLALIEIIDSDFNGFGRIPYRVKTNITNVGEDIFVLGYPLTSTMGDEIKLTTGVISSKSGFQGDVALYQISAPIQPGNSGGPLFDANGNVIGVICAKHNDADNVGYAVKSSYLLNLVDSSISNFRLPSINQVSNLSRPQKIQKLKNFIFLIKCSN